MKVTSFTRFTKRTEDPKLKYIEHRLDRAGIAHRRNGYSFHGPILEVDDARIDEAWQMLNEVVDMGDEIHQRLDDIPDDDAMFEEFA